jgi:hypothetical protein
MACVSIGKQREQLVKTTSSVPPLGAPELPGGHLLLRMLFLPVVMVVSFSEVAGKQREQLVKTTLF